MACSRCGGREHNIQTCPFVRRCGACGGRGHDRRHCPAGERGPEVVPAPRARALATALVDSRDDLLAALRRCIAEGEELLAHLYWRENEVFRVTSLRAYERGQGWPLVATRGHGVQKPDRATINFFAADEAWLTKYAQAAVARSLHHGLLIRRAALEQLGRRPGYELADVDCRYPSVDELAAGELWKFDVPQHRYRALHDLCSAKVVRLATPAAEPARQVAVPGDAVVHVW